MRVETQQILWNGKEPILSIDFHPHSMKFATGGSDKDVKVRETLGARNFVCCTHLQSEHLFVFCDTVSPDCV
jgi:WD40 repeat protein